MSSDTFGVHTNPIPCGAASLAYLTQYVDVVRVALEAEQPCANKNKAVMDNKVVSEGNYNRPSGQ